MGIQKIHYAIAVLLISFFSFTPAASAQDVGDEQTGIASWYGKKYHGRRTTSGDVYNRFKHTAAHNGLPLGTKVKVTNLATGKSVIVKINDRGPFKAPRVIDLSESAFKQIASRKVGLTDIRVEVLELPGYFLAKRDEARKKLELLEAREIMAAVTPAVVTDKVLAFIEVPTPTETVLPGAPKLTVFEKIALLPAKVFGPQTNAEPTLSLFARVFQKSDMARPEDTLLADKANRITAGRAVSKAMAEQTLPEPQADSVLVQETAAAALSTPSSAR